MAKLAELAASTGAAVATAPNKPRRSAARMDVVREILIDIASFLAAKHVAGSSQIGNFMFRFFGTYTPSSRYLK
jgi:hypothetical protein